MRKKHRPVSSINVTPMVDVMLVLLIVFMVTAPLLTVGVPVNLPKVEANSLDAQKEPLEISINENNDIYLGEELIPFEELILKVKTIAGSNTDIRIFLRADTTINYGEVMKVLGALNTSGFLKIALVTKKPSLLSTIILFNTFRYLILFIENFSYKKSYFYFQIFSFLLHLLILIPMINFTFEKKISDIPMILPIEMFIIEEETAAPEFVEEINEIVPIFQEEAPKQNETKAIEPELKEITSQEPIDQIIQDTNEEVLIDNSADKTNEFIIDEKVKPEIKKPEEETPPPIENDFEIKLKQKPEPKEILEPKKDIEIVVKKKPVKKTFNVSTVLKDLENQNKEFKKEQEASEVKQEEVFTEKVGPTMTISEIDLLRQQLHGCLNLNVGVANLKEIKPVIYIEVNPDRTVKSSKVVNKEKLNDPSVRTAAEAAMRAVNNPDCSTLLLPEDKYEQWKEINFTFDFSWMFD